MGKYIIEADRRLLDKLQIQPDALCRGVAGTPAGFHVFDLNTRRMKSCFSFPVRQARANPCVQLCAVKAVQKRLPLCGRIARMDLQNDVLIAKEGVSSPRSWFQTKTAAFSPEIDGLSVGKIRACGRRARGKNLLPAFNPAALFAHKARNILLRQPGRRGNLNDAVRRQHAKVHIFDGLSDDGDGHAVDEQLHITPLFRSCAFYYAVRTPQNQAPERKTSGIFDACRQKISDPARRQAILRAPSFWSSLFFESTV